MTITANLDHHANPLARYIVHSVQINEVNTRPALAPALRGFAFQGLLYLRTITRRASLVNPAYDRKWHAKGREYINGASQHMRLKHSFRTAICDLVASNQVLSVQICLQRLCFDHCQRFLVDKSGSKQTHKYSKTDKGVGAQTLEHVCSVIVSTQGSSNEFSTRSSQVVVK